MIKTTLVTLAAKPVSTLCGGASITALLTSLMIGATGSDDHWDALVKVTGGCLAALSGAVVTLFFQHLAEVRERNKLAAKNNQILAAMKQNCPCMKGLHIGDGEDDE